MALLHIAVVAAAAAAAAGVGPAACSGAHLLLRPFQVRLT